MFHHNNRVFAVELIDERNYRKGRLIDGKYFFNFYADAFNNVPLYPKSVVGLKLSGLVKIREFFHGYVWSRFQFNAVQTTFIDQFITFYLSSSFDGERESMQEHYNDTHDRNFMFELISPNDEGWPFLFKDWNLKIKFFKVGGAIDLLPV